MSFQSAPDCVEAVFNASYEGVPIANVVNFKFPSAYGQSDLDALATAMDTWVGAEYLPLVNAGVGYLDVAVRGLTSAIDMFSVNGAHAGVGGLTGGYVTGNVTACISIRTGFTGRSARGRFYAWPANLAQLASTNHWGNAYLTNLINALYQMKSDAAGIGWAMIVLSRRHLGAVRPTAVGLPVTSFLSTDSTVDTQRGRLR